MEKYPKINQVREKGVSAFVGVGIRNVGKYIMFEWTLQYPDPALVISLPPNCYSSALHRPPADASRQIG
jgi:hypothetical protein